MKTQIVKLKVDDIEREFTLKPLNWEHFPKLFALMNLFKNKEEDIFNSLDEITIKKIMDLEYEMFKTSYPEMKEDELKALILPNVFILMEPLFTINIPQDELSTKNRK